MKKEFLREYARIAVQIGVNIQKGQTLVISSPVECAEFTRMLVEEAYSVGARDVIVNWNDDQITRNRYLMAEDSVFDEVYPWRVMMNDKLSEGGAAFLSVVASDPEALKGVDPNRLRRSSIANGKANEKFYARMMASQVPWSVIAMPVPVWAEKVFPEEKNAEKATEKLWDAIMETVRIREGGNAVAEWRAHCDRLTEQSAKLNAYNFRTLKYKNSLGTNLTIGLPEGHIWAGGSESDGKGTEFIPNMPTEEIFTAPKRDSINGVVYSSKPLVLKGNVVEGIKMTFKDGRIVDVSAKKGEEYIKAEIDIDEGAHYIGEVALVPYHSPISSSGILFYDTLFDENASCHLAFGEAYPTCVKGGADMTKEELLKAGLNSTSNTHVDFMIGTSDLSIIGITEDGREIPVFENGDFAI